MSYFLVTGNIMMSANESEVLASLEAMGITCLVNPSGGYQLWATNFSSLDGLRSLVTANSANIVSCQVYLGDYTVADTIMYPQPDI